MYKNLTVSSITAFLLATNLYSKDDVSTIYVTSATKSEQSIKDVTSSINVITKEEIEERHYTTVSEALNTIPGVSVTSNGGIGQLDSLYIRGVDTKRVLIVIDGIRYNEPAGLSGAPLAQLMIEDVERIEVLKGAQSGIWGADASGGVVNIITKTTKKGLRASILGEYGTYNSQKFSANISNRTELGYIKFNASRIKTDGFSAFEAKKGSANYGTRGDKLGLEDDGYENNTYNISAGLNITKKDELSLTYKKIDAEYDYDSSSADNKTNKSYINHYFKSGSYKHKEENFSVRLDAKQARFDRTNGSFNARSLVNEFALLTDYKYKKDSNLVFGLNKQNFEDINNNRKYNTKAVFISNNIKFDKLILAQTLRYDNNSKYEEKVTGKFGAKYLFTKDFSVVGNYGTAYNAPTLGNLSYTPTLKPENTKSWDIGFDYKELSVKYFETRIEDMIDYSFTPSFHYINRDGESKLKGVEVAYKKEVYEDSLLSLGYTHLDAKDSNKQDLARRAKDKVDFAVDYYGIEDFHFNVNGSYVGSRYDKANKQGAQTGKYTLFNTVVNYEINKNFKTYIKVNNITDKYYQTVDGYATAGRSAYVGIKATF